MQGKATEAGASQMQDRPVTDPSAVSPFDERAATYDETFTRSTIGARMRAVVWRRLDAAFPAGAHVLELGCGTGEDAVHLGRRGVSVVATDPAAAMVRETRAKADRAGVGDRVTTRVLDAARIDELGDARFEGAFSNFGALNCVADLAPVSAGLARLVRPGGRVLLCLMGRYVPWEWGWFLVHGPRKSARRRFEAGGVAWRGMRVFYPSLRELKRVFAPGFRCTGTRAVGVFVPPSYAEEWARKHPRLLAALDALERCVEPVPPLPSLADHVLLELERR